MNAEPIQLASFVKTALPDAAKSLERAWQRRRQELGSWQPSGGWLLKPRVPMRRTSKAIGRGRA